MAKRGTYRRYNRGIKGVLASTSHRLIVQGKRKNTFVVDNKMEQREYKGTLMLPRDIPWFSEFLTNVPLGSTVIFNEDIETTGSRTFSYQCSVEVLRKKRGGKQ